MALIPPVSRGGRYPPLRSAESGLSSMYCYTAMVRTTLASNSRASSLFCKFSPLNGRYLTTTDLAVHVAYVASVGIKA